MQDQPFVSVITPVYNGEKYLAECIESVLGQTYAAWEYIIVNNCSSDRTLEIAQSYARQDSRIRIHNNPGFVGTVQNHNIGFSLISPQSRYCKVLQADDWLFPDCLARMVRVAEETPSIGIVSAYRIEGVKVNLDGLPYPSTVVPGRQICRLTLLEELHVFGSPTSLLIRSDLIRARKEFFDESNFGIHVDTAACYEALQDTDLGFVHQVLTYTRLRDETETSLSQRMNTYLPGRLLCLKKYGPIYLDPAEYKQCLDRQLNRYDRFLAECVFQRRDNQFWDYHRNALERLGCPLSRIRLLRASFSESKDFLLHTVKTLWQALRLIWNRSTT